MSWLAMRRALIVLLAAAAISPLVGWAADARIEARQIWQMSEYIAVDYGGAVAQGQVVDAGEYAEMQEFAGTIQAKLHALPPSSGAEARLAAAAELKRLVDARASGDAVATAAHRLSREVMTAYGLEAAPPAQPDPSRGQVLYAQQCGSCHGPGGAGDGPIAANLEPRPIAFTDHARAAQRTPLALYQVISQGLAGTAMPSFAHLPVQDRWNLAFYVSNLSNDPALISRGEVLWAETPVARSALPDLATLAQTSENDLARKIGADPARAIVAYLRASPGVLMSTAATAGEERSPLATAREHLLRAVDAYRAGDVGEASRLALSSYLDGVEPIEPTLATRDPALLREIETGMSELRARIQRHAPVGQVDAQAVVLAHIFDRVDQALRERHQSATTAFLGSFTILVREGLEALLIVVGMIAFLRKAGRRDVLRYVHAGWIGALLAGGVTWAIATYLVRISGANREVTEGMSSLFAAVVLLSVGIWMHRKSVAGRWQQYLHARMSTALTGRSAAFLFMLSFIAVYREVFETILFYAAMWTPEDSTPILSGLTAGIALLAVVAFVLLRVGVRLPIGKFFSVSSVLVAILAVVLVGKGVAALQEAGWIHQALVDAPRIEWLGVYPSWQSLLAQAAVALVASGAFLWSARRDARVIKTG